MSDECECPECEEGAGWLATFADLMALLMCFFVLLLSFSEMDLLKYKQVAGSLRNAFGVQTKMNVPDIPKGTSIIAKEFTPGKPEPTLIKVINQRTINDSLQTLEFIRAKARRDVSQIAEKIVKSLQKEIRKGQLELVVERNQIRIRIREKDSFASGSAKLRSVFYPILDKIAKVLNETDGHIIVGGHTDNVPISTRYYPSNWVLSSARAANVVHHLADVRLADPNRIEIRAYADTQPVAANDTPENRARNRRVEVVVSYKDKPQNLSEQALGEPQEAPAPVVPAPAGAAAGAAPEVPVDAGTRPVEPVKDDNAS